MTTGIRPRPSRNAKKGRRQRKSDPVASCTVTSRKPRAADASRLTPPRSSNHQGSGRPPPSRGDLEIAAHRSGCSGLGGRPVQTRRDYSEIMTITERADAFARAFPKWPAAWPRIVREKNHDCLYATWVMGNDYRTRSGLYGAYPHGYLPRVLALFPDARRAGARCDRASATRTDGDGRKSRRARGTREGRD